VILYLLPPNLKAATNTCENKVLRTLKDLFTTVFVLTGSVFVSGWWRHFRQRPPSLQSHGAHTAVVSTEAGATQAPPGDERRVAAKYA